MRTLLLFILIFTFSWCCNAENANANQKIDHPYFHTKEYEKTVEELNVKKMELHKLNEELATIQNEQNQLSSESSGLLEMISFVPFFSYIISILCLSMIFAALYILYLYKYNPGKWFIFFKSSNNIRRLFTTIKKHNALVILICMSALFSPNISRASTNIVADGKYYFFGNNIQKGYVYIKYQMTGHQLQYDTINGIKVYPHFDKNSFEQKYDYLVHEFALGFPPSSSQVLYVIDHSKTIDNLRIAYSFVFRLDNVTVSRIIQKRLEIIPEINSDIKFVELESIISEAKKTNRLNLIRQDCVSTLNNMLQGVIGTSARLQFSYLLVDLEPNKADELFQSVKYKFSEIIGDEHKETMFRAVYSELSKTQPEIYKAGDSFQLDDQTDPVLMVEVARFFDTFDGRVASMIVKNFHLERTTKVSEKTFEHLIDLWKKYRKPDVPRLFDHLTDQFIKFSGHSIATYINFANRIGYNKDEAIESLIKHDEDYNRLDPNSSTLITSDFMNLMSGESLAKHFGYLKTRTAQAPIILDSLLQKRYDLFLNYLQFCAQKDPTTISNLTFDNKLADFSEWDGLVNGRDIKEYRVPAICYLVEKESSAKSPNLGSIKALLQEDTNKRLKALLFTDNTLQGSDFLDELVLYHLYSKMKNAELADVRTILESSIREQTKTRLSRLISDIDSNLQEKRGRIQSARAELENIKSGRMSAKIKLTVIWILLILTFLYISASFFLSIKYSINAVSSYSGTRIGLFSVVFAETFAKFLVPILYFTFEALVVVVVVQLYGFLKSGDGEFPNVQRSLATYREVYEGEPSPRKAGAPSSVGNRS